MRRAIAGLIALVALVVAAPATAQSRAGTVAAPFYTTQDAAGGLARYHYAPRANAFRDASAALVGALEAHCASDASAASLAAARAGWSAALGAWEQLATVPLGPLLDRRSAARIDFAPTRPELLRRAIASAPASPSDFERIGAPAKGLPALEWLLWTAPAKPGTPACAYATAAAREVQAEADALAIAFAADARRELEPADADAIVAEFLNQWIGATERLRWRGAERPLREAAARGGAPAFPRAASGNTAASWARQLAVLRELAIAAPGPFPAPGESALPIETLLRARGHLLLADRWSRQVARTARAWSGLAPAERARLAPAIRELGALRKTAQEDVAPALRVTVGFSDADGD